MIKLAAQKDIFIDRFIFFTLSEIIYSFTRL